MRHRALGSVLVLVSVVAGFTLDPSGAFDGPGCGGDWPAPSNSSLTNPCTLTVAGVPVTVSGTAIPTQAQPQASVRVWLTPRGYPDVVLLECSAAATGESANCGEGIPDESCASPMPHEVCTLLIPNQYRLISLQCHVDVRPKGRFFCQTGLDP